MYLWGAMDRLNRYREFMRQLDLTDAEEVIRKGMYVAPAEGGVAERLVPSVALRPYASHVLVGGIGSGKTTQLLVAADLIEARCPDTWAVYVDVSRRHRLAELAPGVLVALAGLVIEGIVRPNVIAPRFTERPSEVHRALERVRRWAKGEHVDPAYLDEGVHEGDGAVWVDGLLKSPEPLREQLSENLDDIETLRNALPKERQNVTILFDSLDRLDDVDTFVRCVEQDLRALRRLGIGVVMTAPLQAMFGAKRADLDRFDVVLQQSAVDVTNDTTGLAFLSDVLFRRAPAGLLSPDAAAALSHASGGVLRDLIGLARSAVEEAYMRGADVVDVASVRLAIDRFGRKRMLGLRSNEIDLLDRVRRTGRFVPTTDDEVALLVTRRVLEYEEDGVRFAVHPTLVPLLESLKDAA